MAVKSSDKSTYSSVWDTYVTREYPQIKDRRNARADGPDIEWPGDEWGEEQEVKTLFSQSFPAFDTEAELCFIELGVGAGRYSVEDLARYEKARLLAFDVSAAFLASLEHRLADHGFRDKARLVQLDGNPDQICQYVEDAGLTGKVDAFFSYDAMVHVDLQTLVVYAISAGLVLRDQGWLVMNVADATSENGMDRLLRSSRRIFSEGGQASTRFIWHSPQVFERLFEKLGFALTLDHTNGRDLYLRAHLIDRGRAISVARDYGRPV